MSVLSTLDEMDGWIELEPAGEDAGPHTLGTYEGENVNYGFETSDEGETLDGDEYHVYQSGRYTVETREDDEGVVRVRVSRHGVEGKTFRSTLYTGDGKCETTVPAPLAREVGFDRVDSEETRVVDGEEQTVTRGVYVSLSFEWNENGFVMTVKPATDEEIRQQESEDETSSPRIRRIQINTSGEHTQYSLYVPGSAVASMGLAPHEFEWRLDDGALVATVVTVEEDGIPISTSSTNIADLPRAPVALRYFREETTPDAENVVSTQTIGDLEVGFGITDETYADVSDENRIIEITERGKFDQKRFILPIPHAKSLGLIPERKVELVDPDNRPEVAFLTEWTPEGVVFVFHPNPENIDASRKTNRNVTKLLIDNSVEGAEPVTEDTPLSERYQRAQNRVTTTISKDVVELFDLTHEPIYWWPAVDRFYGTGELILVGRRASDLPDDFSLPTEFVDEAVEAPTDEE